MKMKKNNSQKKWKTFVLLHTVLLLYSVCGVCSKMASNFPVLSYNWILWYGASLLGIGIYALLWQQVIKRMPLSIAYANKAVCIIWAILWSVLLFEEQLQWNMILGAVIIMAGVYIVGSCNE